MVQSFFGLINNIVDAKSHFDNSYCANCRDAQVMTQRAELITGGSADDAARLEAAHPMFHARSSPRVASRGAAAGALLHLCLVQAATATMPFSGEAVVSRQEGGSFARVKGTSPLRRCLATWDRTSGMSKQEWKSTCKRVVKENPGLYSKPF